MRNEKGQFVKGSIPIHGFKKGSIAWNKGKKCLYMIGNTHGFKKGSKVNVGKKNALGYHHTEEAKKNIGLKNSVNMRGKKHSEETKRKMSESHKGEKTWNWIKDRNLVLEKHRLRGTQEWKIWRKEVFERDKYTSGMWYFRSIFRATSYYSYQVGYE